VDSIDPRHLKVRHDQVGLQILGRAQKLNSVARDPNHIELGRQQLGNLLKNCGMIVCYQNTGLNAPHGLLQALD
jgi:hypothetical protein